MEFGEAPPGYRGVNAGKVEMPTSIFGWNLTFKPAAPISPLGYTTLRISFHPGEATSPRSRLAISSSTNRRNALRTDGDGKWALWGTKVTSQPSSSKRAAVPSSELLSCEIEVRIGNCSWSREAFSILASRVSMNPPPKEAMMWKCPGRLIASRKGTWEEAEKP